MNNNSSSNITNKIKNTTNNASKKLNNISNKFENTLNKVKNMTNKTTNNFNERYERAKKDINEKISSSNSLGKMGEQINNLTSVTKNFEEKNTTITKVVFTVFVLIIFGLLLRLGVYLISFFIAAKPNPIVLDGMMSTNSNKTFNVNPTMSDPKPILRSINENQGLEFSWSTWIWIDNIEANNTSKPQKIFSKGKNMNNIKKTFTGISNNEFLMNGPGLYLYNDESKSVSNAITVVVPLFDVGNNQPDTSISSGISGMYDTITITDIPMQKWVNIIIRAQNKTIDIYVNGTLTKRKNYNSVIKQNYGDIFVGDYKNGMNGYISSLRYFNHAIGTTTIQDILYTGPSLKMINDELTKTKPPYLALRWYLEPNMSSSSP